MINIYAITTKRGKIVYIGRTRFAIQRRYYAHKRQGHCVALQQWLKHNESKIILLESVVNKDSCRRERYYVQKYKRNKLFNSYLNDLDKEKILPIFKNKPTTNREKIRLKNIIHKLKTQNLPLLCINLCA